MFDWTLKRLAFLRERWNDGFAARQIAEELGGGVTKNQVIGKLNTLGLIVAGERKRKPRAAPKPKAVTPAVPSSARVATTPVKTRLQNPTRLQAAANGHDPGFVEITPDDDLNIPVEQRKTLLQLGERDCRWGVGDPRSPGFFFCAAPTLEGEPYCGPHCRRAYNPGAKERFNRVWKAA